MTATSPNTVADAKSVTEQVFGFQSPAVRAIGAVMRRLQDYFSKNEKPIANIAVHARVSTRAVEYWFAKDAAQRRTMSAEAFVALLLSDVGGEVLDAMMKSLPARERPRWWLRHSNTARMAEIERLQAEQDEEIKQLRLSLLK